MKILAFSLGPIFPKHVHGGSQKVLKEVAIYLGKCGHKVKIYCTRRDDNSDSFQLGKNVLVVPALRYKQTYPEPHFTSPHNLANIIQDLGKEMKKHDILYIHDGELNWPFLYTRIPTIISFRDFVYPDTLASGFNFTRDILLVNSKYTKECVLSTLGSFRPRLASRIRVIKNGINLKLYRPMDTKLIRRTLKLKKEDIPVLYPHRPDPKKGIDIVFKVIHTLKYRHGLKKVKLLIPRWIDSKISKGKDYDTIFYNTLPKKIKDLDIEKNVVIHGWLPYEKMPEYYCLGAVTLSVGNFVESFSNSTLESIACGTPVVVSRVACYRSNLPDKIVDKVDYGDVEEIARLVIRNINNRNFSINVAREYLASNFSYQKMLEKYESLFTNVKILKPLKFKPINTNPANILYRFPPWCAILKKGIYNDYSYRYIPKDKFYTFILKVGHSPFSCSKAKAEGISKNRLIKEYREGNLVASIKK